MFTVLGESFPGLKSMLRPFVWYSAWAAITPLVLYATSMIVNKINFDNSKLVEISRKLAEMSPSSAAKTYVEIERIRRRKQFAENEESFESPWARLRYLPFNQIVDLSCEHICRYFSRLKFFSISEGKICFFCFGMTFAFVLGALKVVFTAAV